MTCKCDCLEPYNHDVAIDGLWVCKCLEYKPKLIDGQKPLDYVIEQINKLDSDYK